MNIADSNFPVSIGIRKIIAKKGLTRAFIAAQSGFKLQELSDMLNGRRLVRVCDIPVLANALGVTIEDIFKEGGVNKNAANN